MGLEDGQVWDGGQGDGVLAVVDADRDSDVGRVSDEVAHGLAHVFDGDAGVVDDGDGLSVACARGCDFEVDGLVVLEGFCALRDEGVVLG